MIRKGVVALVGILLLAGCGHKDSPEVAAFKTYAKRIGVVRYTQSDESIVSDAATNLCQAIPAGEFHAWDASDDEFRTDAAMIRAYCPEQLPLYVFGMMTHNPDRVGEIGQVNDALKEDA